jgi:murein DD-endopeptidase MepM/ murein hydrolase activator NlpD
MNGIRYSIYFLLTIFLLTEGSFDSFAKDVVSLPNLDDAHTEAVRKDVKKTLSVVKGSQDAAQLPALTFYSYTLKKGETFWKVVSRTALNVDTMMSINNLSSPYSIKEGDTIYFANMRGIIIETKGKRIADIEKEFGVPSRLILSANRISTLSKPYIFIPSGEVSKLERSLFLGTGFAAPLAKLRRTSNFGIRNDPFTGERSFHTGVDLGCPVNTAVYAARTGKVVFAGYEGDYGQLVIIEHPHGYFSYYGHLSKIRVKKGETVTANTCIALSGNTGRTTGPHLHFEIRKKSKPINPVIVLR